MNDHYIKMYKEIGMLLSLIPGKILERDATRNELYDTLAKIEEIKIREAGEIAMKSDNYTGKDKKISYSCCPGKQPGISDDVERDHT